MKPYSKSLVSVSVPISRVASPTPGLNKTILALTWGKTKEFLSYKFRRSGKLVVEVPAYYSSQACAACGHTHLGNRVCQSEFVCQSCDQRVPADHNAVAVIAKRSVQCAVGAPWCLRSKDG